MRNAASVMHLDMDAFFSSVEQRDKPSLRGKPVIVGGLGARGVVSTASYEARPFGVGSAMPMHEARRKCPNAAFLAGRFTAYRQASDQVMAILRDLSPAVEAMSLDEAYVDLAQGPPRELDDESLLELAQRVRRDVFDQTGGLTCSVGLGTSKFMAKVASELAKPDGLRLVAPGAEEETIAGLSARAIPGVGPATMERLDRLGVSTVADIRQLSKAELTRALGKAGAEMLHDLARAQDDRPVEAVRETKSISVEDTFEQDLVDVDEIKAVVARHSSLVAARLAKAGLFARTVTLKTRWPDLSGSTRSRTLHGATDSAEQIAAIASGLLDGLDVGGGVRLVGVGVSGLTQIAQEPLFDLDSLSSLKPNKIVEENSGTQRRPRLFLPGADVVHAELGPGWVWGSGLGRVTVRFETAATGPGPVRTFAADDPDLALLD